ncbi:uncharacterized protein V1516DRAFT_353121 [Lipomyces oligophaga]|uniref:uncharacterized protein n=1 Tax=Lipomyces oligophaga TaxID=45792 RepID=UPI0034CF247B
MRGFIWNPERKLYEGSEVDWSIYINRYPYGKHFSSKSFFYEDLMDQIFRNWSAPPSFQIMQFLPTDKVGSLSSASHPQVIQDTPQGNARHTNERNDVENRDLRGQEILSGSPSMANLFEQDNDIQKTAHQEIDVSDVPVSNGELMENRSSIDEDLVVRTVNRLPDSSSINELDTRRQTLKSSAVHTVGGSSPPPGKRIRTFRYDFKNFEGSDLDSDAAVNSVVSLVTESVRQIIDTKLHEFPMDGAQDRFQRAIRLLSTMRADCHWSKNEYKRALRMIRELDDSGVIMFLEMDSDTREDFVMGDEF